VRFIRRKTEKAGATTVEVISSPGDGTLMHAHQNEDKHIVVLERTARIAYGDKVFDAEAGKVVTLLRKIPQFGPFQPIRNELKAMRTPTAAEKNKPAIQ
jgi:uncharacterized RmlC-like cupin family protein